MALLPAALLVFTIILLSLYLGGAFQRRDTYHRNLIGIPASVSHFPATLASFSDSLQSKGRATAFWSEIEVIQTARLRAIESAQESIQFETFMMKPGQRADAFAQVLCQKAAAGVRVQVLADSYGAHFLPSTYWRRLTNAGVEVRFFNPLDWRSPTTYLCRNHRKLLIIDQQTALIGGAGIADDWDGLNSIEPWLDFEVQWQGDAVGILVGLFGQHWLDGEGIVDLSEHRPHASRVDAPDTVLITSGEDPTLRNSPIRSLFQICALAAQERLWIASPYLLPDDGTCAILAQAHQQGADVRILTMGPRCDKPFVYYTARERYGPLLQGGIKLHEYQPAMMHAKIMLIDRSWVSLGSANLDPRSFFHNDELNLCTPGAHLCQAVEDFFEKAFSKSVLIQPQEWRKRPIKERLMGQVSNSIYWLM